MARVALFTQWATYQGELDLAAPGGQVVRFLDALNHPQRLALGSSRATPKIVLSSTVRRDNATGLAISLGSDVALRPSAVIAAYEIIGQERQLGKDHAVTTAYEQGRHTQELVRIYMYLENGWRLEANVTGATTLDTPKPGREFVACLDCVLTDPRWADAPKSLDFVAVNIGRLESSGVLASTAGAAASS